MYDNTHLRRMPLRVYRDLFPLPQQALWVLLLFPRMLLLKSDALDVLIILAAPLMRLESAPVVEGSGTCKALKSHHKEEKRE